MWYSLASYAALAALGLLAIRYYNPQFFNKFRSTPTPQPSTEQKPSKKQKSKKAKPSDEKATSAPASRSEGPSKKRKIISPPSKSVNAETREEDEVDNSMSNKELAQQLAQVQAGVKLEKKPAGGRQSRVTVPSTLKAQQTLAESPSLSANTSSTGGRDADDDLSPNETPPLSVPLTAGTSLAGDVSDMLEPAGPAPKTLRITDVKVTEKKQVRRNYEPVLTKKQKQRQKIQEENRRLKEESDRLHEAKKQQQLTTARLAAGTSNQTKANSFAAGTQNAWQKQSEGRPGQDQTKQQQPPPLLDTFETDKAAVAAKTHIPAAAAPEQVTQTSTNSVETSNPHGRPRGTSWADQVNEDAQNEWAKSLVEDESWEPVTTKKSRKKNRKDTDTSSEASAAVSKLQGQGVTNGGRKDSFGTKSQHGINGDNRFASIEELNGDSWEA
ncbi:hypothetical protein DV735_g4035, partial [Chaetothyriales sp. CBS 134920]